MSNLEPIFESVRREFEKKSGLIGVEYELKKKESGSVLVLLVANPTERLFKVLEDARREGAEEGEELPLVTLRRKKTSNLIEGAEGQLLLKILSESQNVNRYSFEQDFMSRYTRSVSGAESQVVATANHVILGRRGAGKSMLLLYAWHERKRESNPSVWIDMQVFSGRGDIAVIADVLVDLIEQTSELLKDDSEQMQLTSKLRPEGVTLDQIRRLLPSIRRWFGKFAGRRLDLFVFLDDFHVLDKALQPILLDVLYAFARGNRVFLKLSAIEALTRTYDPVSNTGLEVPQDAQYIRLDYNLTTPDKTTDHIEAILNAHARYAGLQSIRRLCTSADVIPRLTWVAAGVPRDALSLFSQAMTKASIEGRQRVSVSNVNVAASETLSTKLRDLNVDASQDAMGLKELVESIRRFCVTENRKNAFLVEFGADADLFEGVMQLVHLRLLHVISEGITTGEAGRKYLGLILDYGFYTGIRAAQSVDLFNRRSTKVAYKELRRLPVFRH